MTIDCAAYSVVQMTLHGGRGIVIIIGQSFFVIIWFFGGWRGRRGRRCRGSKMIRFFQYSTKTKRCWCFKNTKVIQKSYRLPAVSFEAETVVATAGMLATTHIIGRLQTVTGGRPSLNDLAFSSFSAAATMLVGRKFQRVRILDCPTPSTRLELEMCRLQRANASPNTGEKDDDAAETPRPVRRPEKFLQRALRFYGATLPVVKVMVLGSGSTSNGNWRRRSPIKKITGTRCVTLPAN